MKHGLFLIPHQIKMARVWSNHHMPSGNIVNPTNDKYHRPQIDVYNQLVHKIVLCLYLLLKAMSPKQEIFELISSTRFFQKSFDMFSYFRRKSESTRTSTMTDDSLSKVSQSVQLAEENAVSSIEPEVRDIECVMSSPPAVPSLIHELKDTTRNIKLLHQTIDPIPPFEFENAKSFIIYYLTLPHISKLSNCYQKGFLDAICMLRRNPALSSYVYEKLTILEHRFPQLVAEFDDAQQKQEVAKSFVLKHTHVIVNLKIFNDEVKEDPESYKKKLESEIRSAESQPAELANIMCRANKVVNMYHQLEVASLRILSAKRDIIRILNEVEELCGDISL